jgi:K+/H+ antiporter YhaU regulatory subunit KhtT
MKYTIREQRLPGIGVRYDLNAGDRSGLFVIIERGGRRIIGLSGTADHPERQITIDRDQAVMIAALLLGARFTVDTSHDQSVPADEVVVDTAALTESSPAIGRTLAEIHLPDPDAVVLAVISDATPQVIEDQRNHRCTPEDRLVIAARATRIDQITRYLAGTSTTDAPSEEASRPR